MVHGIADVEIIDNPAEIAALGSPAGKPFLRVTFPGLPPINITTNLAEMLGGAGAGCRQRYGY